MFAKNLFLTAINNAKWGDDMVDSFNWFFHNLDNHPIREEGERGEKALLLYASRARTDWHDKLTLRKAYNIATINEDLLTRIAQELDSREVCANIEQVCPCSSTCHQNLTLLSSLSPPPRAPGPPCPNIVTHDVPPLSTGHPTPLVLLLPPMCVACFPTVHIPVVACSPPPAAAVVATTLSPSPHCCSCIPRCWCRVSPSFVAAAAFTRPLTVVPSLGALIMLVHASPASPRPCRFFFMPTLAARNRQRWQSPSTLFPSRSPYLVGPDRPSTNQPVPAYGPQPPAQPRHMTPCIAIRLSPFHLHERPSSDALQVTIQRVVAKAQSEL